MNLKTKLLAASVLAVFTLAVIAVNAVYLPRLNREAAELNPVSQPEGSGQAGGTSGAVPEADRESRAVQNRVTVELSDTGLYTVAQANAGAQLYTRYCAGCHGQNLEGVTGPALSGDAFTTNYENGAATAGYLFDLISAHMPATAPGSLSEDQYLKILTYLLAQNHYPAGRTPLEVQALGQITLTPQPAD